MDRCPVPDAGYEQIDRGVMFAAEFIHAPALHASDAAQPWPLRGLLQPIQPFTHLHFHVDLAAFASGFKLRGADVVFVVDFAPALEKPTNASVTTLWSGGVSRQLQHAPVSAQSNHHQPPEHATDGSAVPQARSPGKATKPATVPSSSSTRPAGFNRAATNTIPPQPSKTVPPPALSQTQPPK
jgi:hypothetical protein